MHLPGIEPGSLAWEANIILETSIEASKMLQTAFTTRPQVLLLSLVDRFLNMSYKF